MNLNAPQPAPSRGEGDEVWPLIFNAPGLVLPEWLKADMRARNDIGAAKYGTPLRVWNGRDCVVDAYQEALDLIVYVKQARERMGPYSLRQPDTINVHVALDIIFHHALGIASQLGELARTQKVPTTPKAGTR